MHDRDGDGGALILERAATVVKANEGMGPDLEEGRIIRDAVMDGLIKHCILKLPEQRSRPSRPKFDLDPKTIMVFPVLSEPGVLSSICNAPERNGRAGHRRPDRTERPQRRAHVQRPHAAAGRREAHAGGRKRYGASAACVRVRDGQECSSKNKYTVLTQNRGIEILAFT
jgi:hypothetical protein